MPMAEENKIQTKLGLEDKKIATLAHKARERATRARVRLATNEEEQETIKEISPIRTYESDVREAVQDRGVSALGIRLAEKRRKRARGEDVIDISRAKHRRDKIIASIIILILVGIGALGIFIYLGGEETVQVPEVVMIKSLIPAEKEVVLGIKDLSIDAIDQTMREVSADAILPKGSILNISILDRNKKIETGDLLEILGATPPSSFLRTLDDEFMLGLISELKDNPFLILKSRSFAHAFSGMLAWEKDLVSDLGSLLRGAPSLQPPFEDLIISNRDTRVIKDTVGNIFFIYSIIDNETILITTDNEVFETVVESYISTLRSEQAPSSI